MFLIYTFNNFIKFLQLNESLSNVVQQIFSRGLILPPLLMFERKPILTGQNNNLVIIHICAKRKFSFPQSFCFVVLNTNKLYCLSC